MTEWMAEWDGDHESLNFHSLDGSYEPPKNPKWKVLGKVTNDFVANYLENEHERSLARACR